MQENTEIKVQIIEPVKKVAGEQKKLRVCAYARVSTGNDEQKISFENQKKYYTDMITSNNNYIFAGVFSDEGISGTTDKRPGFLRMIELAKQGRIDIIYTKSISRFTRNTDDLSKYCKILREHNVDVIFEEENLRLLDASGTLLLTVLGAIYQMEVENTKERVNWTFQKRMERGELVGQANPLGYDVVNGKIVVNEDEAEIVRFIFKRYLEGVGGARIAKELEAMGVKTKRGNTTWNNSTVLGIIKNEKYIGTLLQGKTYTVDMRNHIRKDNKGDVRSYRIDGHHEPIISLEDFEKANALTESRCVSYADGRRKGKTANVQFNPFTSKLVCAYCGKSYVRRKVHAGTKYEKTIWNCTTKVKQGVKCCPHSKPIEEDYLKQSVVLMIKNLLDDKDSLFYLSNGKLHSLLLDAEKNKDTFVEQIIKYEKQVEKLKKKKEKLFDIYLEDTITEEKYNQSVAGIDKNIASILELITDMKKSVVYVDEKKATISEISQLIEEGSVEGFDERLFNYIINNIVIGGRRSDGVDDPRSLHYELIPSNLSTDLSEGFDPKGVFRYSSAVPVCRDNEETDSLCSLYSVPAR